MTCSPASEPAATIAGANAGAVHAHYREQTGATLDGWNDDPAAVEEDAILARLLALNLARSGG